MVKFSRILLPIDFSERCLGMTLYAKALAEKYGSEITLLHVINPVFITPEIGMAPPAAIAVPQWLIAEKTKLLEEFAARELAGLPVRRLVYEGIPEMMIYQRLFLPGSTWKSISMMRKRSFLPSLAPSI